VVLIIVEIRKSILQEDVIPAFRKTMFTSAHVTRYNTRQRM